jgi:hypothetical protein
MPDPAWAEVSDKIPSRAHFEVRFYRNLAIGLVALIVGRKWPWVAAVPLLYGLLEGVASVHEYLFSMIAPAVRAEQGPGYQVWVCASAGPLPVLSLAGLLWGLWGRSVDEREN